VGNSGKTVGNDSSRGSSEASAPHEADVCPRCGAAAAAEACPRCGLRRAHRERFAAETALPEGLAQDWENVLASWSETSAHAVFIQRCALAQALDLAAARYRPLLNDAARSERARASLDRIVALAEESLQRSAVSKDRVERTRRVILGVAVFIMFAFLAVVAYAVLTR
jgi:hypothetical protein